MWVQELSLTIIICVDSSVVCFFLFHFMLTNFSTILLYLTFTYDMRFYLQSANMIKCKHGMSVDELNMREGGFEQ